MHLYSLILLVVAVVHGVNCAVLRSTDTSIMMAPPIASSQGLLRSHKTEDVDYDERVDMHGLSSKIASLMSKTIKSSSQNQVKRWMQYQFHPQELFTALQLGKAATKLDDSTNLLEWFRYIVAFRSKNGDQAFSDLDMYYLLLKTNSADEIATLFQTLKKTPGLKGLSASMQQSLSGSWIKSLRKKENPKVVFEMLRLESAGVKLDETPLFHQWLKYVDMYRANNGYFYEGEMLHLLLRTMPEEDVVRLVHKLRQTPDMQNRADFMQRILFSQSKTSHKFMRDVWLKTRESPEEVYKILRLDEVPMDAFANNAKLFQWLRYIQQYRTKNENLFSNAQLYQFLEKKIKINYGELGALFQVIKEAPGLNRIGESMQTTLFKKLIRQELTPEGYKSVLVVPYSFEMMKKDPRFRTLKAYTLQFAKERGGDEVLKKVNALFARGNPRGALTAAVS